MRPCKTFKFSPEQQRELNGALGKLDDELKRDLEEAVSRYKRSSPRGNLCQTSEDLLNAMREADRILSRGVRVFEKARPGSLARLLFDPVFDRVAERVRGIVDPERTEIRAELSGLKGRGPLPDQVCLIEAPRGRRHTPPRR